jgi:NADH-ubiquinone oxidoreductase chain 5
MNDIKKIIAYSTMSQLGYMVVSIGLSSYTLALFHLVNHAFFKASLFMAAGAIIHATNDNQSIVKYGGLSKSLPFIGQVILISSLALLAYPFTSGYYSKELIISMTRNIYNPFYETTSFISD